MRTQIHHLIAEAARRTGDAPALVAGGGTLSYADLWDAVQRAAGGLRRLGLTRRERVAVYLDKRLEAVTATFGVSAARGVFVPVNPLLQAGQVGHVLRDCGAAALVTTPRQLRLLRAELARCQALREVIVAGGGAVDDDPAAYRVVDWSDLTGATSEPLPEPGIDADMAAILYTSGSSGKAKGVVLSHRNMLTGAESVSEYLGNGPDDVIAAMLPLSFDAGFSQLTTAFSVGAKVVLHTYLTPVDAIRACARHGVTGLTCVPPQWNRLAELPWPAEAASRLRYFANTGGRLPKATLDLLRKKLANAKPFLMYGLTEAFRSTYLDPAEVDGRPDSIGKAIPNAEIMVVRPDGTLCKAGEPGELVHRGALVALGYWNDPVRTAERFRPAPGAESGRHLTEYAVYSGDLVMRDKEGFHYFLGRLDEMIKTSGYRVSPTEVEEAAYNTGLVRDAVAFGIDDGRHGQEIALVTTPATAGLSVEALRQQLRHRLPSYMVPRLLRVQADIPRGPNGKFDRASLRRELTL